MPVVPAVPGLRLPSRFRLRALTAAVTPNRALRRSSRSSLFQTQFPMAPRRLGVTRRLRLAVGVGQWCRNTRRCISNRNRRRSSRT